MHSTTAYFAGAGTVIVAIAAGLGGGLLLGDIMNPQPQRGGNEITLLEQRMSQFPIPATNGAPQPVPYLEGTQFSATAVEGPAQPQRQEAQPRQVQQASTQPAAAKERNAPARSAAAAQGAGVEQPAARERTASDDSFATARDADLKRDAHRADDKRRAERRQRWAERRKWRQRQGDDLNDAGMRVREVTEPRPPLFGRESFFETGRMTLFDD